MRSALIVMALALSAFAAPLPAEQARDTIAMHERNYRISGSDSAELYVREEESEVLPRDVEAREAAPGTYRPADRREAKPGTYRPADRREAKPGTYRPADRREAKPGTYRPADRRDASPQGGLRVGFDERDASPQGGLRVGFDERDAEPEEY
ncbi:hypothetical protein BS50DRAFT_24207 [Corynespora cassiicola Philippines]|uniref:Uncharacterized protein n=1 Tax=Corynespora cassiicola Philippines TaxID=1448308 RepID=A0A2T2PAV7_CORCC|nr:hypothetical protein BS50DRAFT_24207 [Corynespora cassiicola Philippines]